jgi:hypothetical protein
MEPRHPGPMGDDHERRARARELGAAVCTVLAAGQAVAAPLFPGAGFLVGFGLLSALGIAGLLVLERTHQARRLLGLVFLPLLVVQIGNSTLVLSDPRALVTGAVHLVGVPLVLLTVAFALATAALDWRRRAWGERYQEKVGYDRNRSQPTADWG